MQKVILQKRKNARNRTFRITFCFSLFYFKDLFKNYFPLLLGETPLHIAAHHLAENNVRALVAAGADVNAVILTSTPTMSIKKTKRRLLRQERDSHNAYTPLHCVLECCLQYENAHTLSLIRFLLINGADVNAVSNDAVTPLDIWTRQHFAFPSSLAIDRECLLLEVLLSAGARLTKEQGKRQPLAHIAVHSSNYHLLNLYSAYGGDLDVYDANGVTPLHLAHLYRSNEMLKHLLHLGAHIDAVDSYGLCVFDAMINETSNDISAGKKITKAIYHFSPAETLNISPVLPLQCLCARFIADEKGMSIRQLSAPMQSFLELHGYNEDSAQNKSRKKLRKKLCVIL